MFMNNIVDFFDRGFDLIAWCIGIGLLILAFLVGGYAGTMLRGFVRGIGQGVSVNFNHGVVDVVLRFLVVLAAGCLCYSYDIPLAEAISDVLPVDDFDALAQNFFQGKDQWLVSNTISVFWNQMILALISFLPFFLITGVIGIIKDFLADPEEGPVYQWVAFIPEVLTLMASNVLFLLYGEDIAEMLLDFVQSIRVEEGLIRFLILALILFIYLYYVISDMFDSDVFISMMAVNIAAAILGANPSGEMRIVMICVSLVLGYASSIIRRKVLTALTGEREKGMWWLFSTIYGLVAMGVLLLLSLGILRLTWG